MISVRCAFASEEIRALWAPRSTVPSVLNTTNSATIEGRLWNMLNTVLSRRQIRLTLRFSRGALMIAPRAVGCKRLILIQPSPCTYQLGRLSAGTCAYPRRRRADEILQRSASSLLRNRSPREDHVRLYHRRRRPGARASQCEIDA